MPLDEDSNRSRRVLTDREAAVEFDTAKDVGETAFVNFTGEVDGDVIEVDVEVEGESGVTSPRVPDGQTELVLE